MPRKIFFIVLSIVVIPVSFTCWKVVQYARVSKSQVFDLHRRYAGGGLWGLTRVARFWRTKYARQARAAAGRILKRTLDILVSATMLVCLAPLAGSADPPAPAKRSELETAVDKALAFLAANQEKDDGSWKEGKAIQLSKCSAPTIPAWCLPSAKEYRNPIRRSAKDRAISSWFP